MGVKVGVMVKVGEGVKVGPVKAFTEKPEVLRLASAAKAHT